MKIKVIGCGNAFSTKNFNQSFILEENGKKMLIDCGTTTQMALLNAKISVSEIDAVYISHAHADHAGGLEFMAFSRYDWVTQPHPRSGSQFKVGTAPTLFAEEGLMSDLWDHTLSGGLESMEGFKADINTFFHAIPVDIDKGFNWEGWHFQLIQQIHIMAGSKILPTFGLMMLKYNHPKVYLTTDSQHCSPSQVEEFYRQADIVIQDCEISPFLSNVHANYIQLAGHSDANARALSADIKKKMWLSHYQDFYNAKKKMTFIKSPYAFYKQSPLLSTITAMEDFDWDESAKKDGFAGFVKVGQEFEI